MAKNPIKLSEAQILRAALDTLDIMRIPYIRNNNFCGKIQRPNGSMGYMRNSSFPGSPDLIIFIRNGRCIHCEFKSEKGRQSEEQKNYEKKITSLGYTYVIVRSPDEFISLIQTANAIHHT